MTAAPEAIEGFLLSVLRETWDVFQKQALVFVLAAATVMLLSLVSLGLLMGPLTVGFLDMARRARAGELLQVGDVFGRFDSFFSSLFATILIAIAVALGCSLLLVPGLLAALFSGFTLHAIAYERLTSIDAIKRSVEIVRGHFLGTLVLFLLISIVQTIGGSVVLGALLTLPLGLIASALAYQQLAGAQPAQLAGV